jgi:hypothetical protein
MIKVREQAEGEAIVKLIRDAGKEDNREEIRLKIQGMVNADKIMVRAGDSVKTHGTDNQQKQTKWSLEFK